MVDFGDTIFQTEVKPEVPVVEPIRDQSGEMFASALSNTIQNAGSIFTDPRAAKAKADAAKGSALSEVTEYVNLLADARDQGVPTDEINRMLRVKSNQWVSNYPELTDEIFTQINKMTGENGLAGNINRETPEETGRRKRIEQATADGWDMSNPESAAAFEQYEQDKLNLMRITQKIEGMEAEGKVATAQMKSEAIGTLHSLIKNGLPWANDQINKAYNLLKTTTDPAARQAIIDKTKETIAQQTALINSTRTQTNNEIDTSYLTAGIDGLVKQFEDTATGASTLAAYETANKRVAAQYEAMIMSDPKTAALIMLDKASKFQDPNAVQKLDEAKLKLWSSLFAENTINDNGKVSGAKPGDVIDTPQNVATVFEELKNSTNNILKSPDAAPEEIAAQENKIVNVLRSTARYGAGEQDAKNFTAVVDFLADPTIGRFIEQHGGTILPQVAGEAKYVLEQQYDKEVIPLIQERWATAVTQISSALPDLSPAELTGAGVGQFGMGANPDPSAGAQVEDAGISGVIEPTWNGIGVEFKVKDEYKQYAEINRIARDLNQGKEAIAPAINKLIRMTAHLSGNTDYEKTYNEAYAPRLWATGDENASGDSKPDGTLEELTNIPPGALEAPKRPTDYKETPSSLRGQTGQLLDAIGASEGATYNTLFGYAEQPGGAFEDTDITKMTVNDVQALQKKMVSKNGISSAVGKYQFIQDTLKEAIKGLGLTGDEKFTPELQDRLAVWLLKNRTSFNDWVLGGGDPKKFQNELASQWASIPNTSGKSAYAGDGVNSASEYGRKLIGML